MNRKLLDATESVSQPVSFTGVVAVLTVTQIQTGHTLMLEIETEPGTWTPLSDAKREPLEFGFIGAYVIDVAPNLPYRVRERSGNVGNIAWIGG